MRSHCPAGCAPSPPLQLPGQAPMSVAASCVAPPTAFEMPSCSSCGSGSPWLACTVLAALKPKYVTACRRKRELISLPIAVLPIHRHRWNARCTVLCDGLASAAIAQFVARRSHNPKVVSSILTHRISILCWMLICLRRRQCCPLQRPSRLTLRASLQVLMRPILDFFEKHIWVF